MPERQEELLRFMVGADVLATDQHGFSNIFSFSRDGAPRMY